MRMAMPVKMAMTVESMQCTAEAAICRGATLNEAPVRAARPIWNASGTAIDARHKTHRNRANRRGTHHGQDDTAGTFHAITCAHTLEESRPIQGLALRQTCDRQTSQSQAFHRIVRRTANGSGVSRRRKNAT